MTTLPKSPLPESPAAVIPEHGDSGGRILSRGVRALVAVCGLAGPFVTGCQVDVGGQTLPSAYYLQDDIQYFPAGPEFKLSREAAAQKAYRKEMAETDAGTYVP